MADLPTAAQRVNDIEVSANAPLTESVNRKYGSNINYLLDLLNIPDGETDPDAAGSVGDLLAAATTIGLFNLSLETTIAQSSSGGTYNIGTFTNSDLINYEFFVEFDTSIVTGSNIAVGLASGDEVFNSFSAGVTLASAVNFDAAGSFDLREAQGHQDIGIVNYPAAPTAEKRYGSRLIRGEYYNTDRADGDFIKLCDIDWRDGTSFTLNLTTTVSFSESHPILKVWRGMRLNNVSTFT